jgi:hypothetical protein
MGIYQKINEVMNAVKGVDKTSLNKHGGYRYAGHEAVTATLRGEYAQRGIVRRADMVECDVLSGGAIKVKVLVSFHDTESGEHIDCSMFAVQHCQTKSGAITAQQVGQALSYAVKNVEFKLFSLTGDTEPDSDDTDPDGPADDDEQPRGRRSADATSSRRAREEHTGEPADPEAAERADVLLKAFDVALTEQGVLDASDAIKAEWKALRAVKGLADEVVKRRTAALKRVQAAAKKE